MPYVSGPGRPRTMAREIHYFAYGTLQKGFSNYADMTAVLGEPIGRFRTVEPFAVVVPLKAGCANPGCNLLHRMATLVPEVGSLHVEGDVYCVDADGLREIDRLENYDGEKGTGPYVRREVDVVSVDGSTRLTAQAYRVRDPARWRALVELGRADAVAHYTADMAISTPKDCCVRDPGHAGAHDTIDPLRS
ncbi:MAG: gamma-glutamylaminecyclotransferase [Solirubrobacteraceae bacterium]|nr:gamma-glutamylaminecyclotransferase [Solirubrobacteraceae bacterium]